MTFNREKSKETDASQFSTVHISNPVTRRRTDISSLFANHETGSQQDALTISDTRSTGLSQPFSVHIKNIPIPSKLKFVNSSPKGCHYSDKPLNPVSRPPRLPSLLLDSDCDETPNRTTNGIPPITSSGAPSGPSSGPGTSTPSMEVNLSTASLGEGPRYNKSPPSSTRGHSSSSSYPSEGLRSSPDHCLSPQQNTWTKDFESELSRYSVYPTQGSLSGSPASMNNGSAPHIKGGQCLMEESAAVRGNSATDAGAIGNGFTSQLALSDIPSLEDWQGIDQQQDESRYSTLVETIYKEPQRPPLSQDGTPCMLDGHGSSTSAVRGSFPELRSLVQNESSNDYFSHQPVSNTGSMDRLRPSTETGAARSTRAHQSSQDNHFNTMPASVSVERYPRESMNYPTPPPDDSQIDGTQPPNTSEPSNTVIRQPHSFKLRKWIKKICIRTKVRFDNAIKLEPSSAVRGRKKSKFRKSLRSKKRSGAKKVKSKSKSKPAKPLELPPDATWTGEEETSNKDEGKARRFLRSLTTRKSMQLPMEDENGESNVGHRRVQSLPRDF